MNEIYTRVSIRKFEDRSVETEKITQLIRAAMQAPSAGNQQPWEFYVVTDRDKIRALSKISPYAACYHMDLITPSLLLLERAFILS